MGNHRIPAGALHQLHGFQRFGERANLIEFDQQGVAGLLANAAADALGVGHQQVVANQLHLVAQGLLQHGPAFPVVLGQAVFQRNDGILVNPVFPELDQFFAGEGFAFTAQVVLAIFVKFRGRRVDGNGNFLADLVACFLDGFHDDFDGLGVGLEAGSKAALVAHQRGVAFGFEHTLQRVVDFAAPAQGFGKGRRAQGHDEEFLHIHRLPAGVRAAVEDVHHRRGQHVSVHAAQVAVKRQLQGSRRGLRHRQADAQNGVRTQFGLVGRAIQFQHPLVDGLLLCGVPADEFLGQDGVDVFHRPQHTLAVVAALVAVAQFQRLVHAGRSAGRHRSPSPTAVGQHDFHLDGGVAAGIQNLTAVNHGYRRIHVAPRF